MKMIQSMTVAEVFRLSMCIANQGAITNAAIVTTSRKRTYQYSFLTYGGAIAFTCFHSNYDNKTSAHRKESLSPKSPHRNGILVLCPKFKDLQAMTYVLFSALAVHCLILKDHLFAYSLYLVGLCKPAGKRDCGEKRQSRYQSLQVQEVYPLA